MYTVHFGLLDNDLYKSMFCVTLRPFQCILVMLTGEIVSLICSMLCLPIQVLE